MIPVPSSGRVWLAIGRPDMRRGMNGLALQVHEALWDTYRATLYIRPSCKIRTLGSITASLSFTDIISDASYFHFLGALAISPFAAADLLQPSWPGNVA